MILFRSVKILVLGSLYTSNRLYFVTQLVQEVDVENSLLKDRIVELETEVMALNKVKSLTNFERPGE